MREQPVAPKELAFLSERTAVLKALTEKPEPVKVVVKDDKPVATVVSLQDRIESKEGKDFYKLPLEERAAYNKAHSAQTIYERDIERNDPAVVQAVEELGDKANGEHAKLVVVNIPDGIEYSIEEYDGMEHVAEAHRTWG